MNLHDIDIIKFLEDYDIPYSESGKNIGRGWIGIEECPFCEAPNNHFGIRLASNSGSCFVCGETGNAIRIIEVLARASRNEAYRIAAKYLDPTREITEVAKVGDRVKMPNHFDGLVPLAEKYLSDRGFVPSEITKKYNVVSTGPSSYLKIDSGKLDFSYRLLIPIVMSRKVVAYTGRSYVGKEPRYRHSPLEASVVPAGSALYGIDRVRDKAIIVEGPTDVWRVGDGSIAMMGVKYTREQVRWLHRKGLKEAYVMFDSGARENAVLLARALNTFIKKVMVVTLLSKKDPGDLSVEEAMKIKWELLGDWT